MEVALPTNPTGINLHVTQPPDLLEDSSSLRLGCFDRAFLRGEQARDVDW